MRSSHVKRLNFNKGITSCKEVVATDIALANLEKIEKNELVSRWILNDNFNVSTPTWEHEVISSPWSPVNDLDENVDRNPVTTDVTELCSSFCQNAEKSPVIKCGRKKLTHNSLPHVIKSPIISKNKKSKIRGKTSEISTSCYKRKLDWSHSTSDSNKSPILGKSGTPNSTNKYRWEIKRKRLEDRLDYDRDPLAGSSLNLSPEIVLSGRKIKIETVGSRPELFETERITSSPSAFHNNRKIKIETVGSSPELFETERITSSPSAFHNNRKIKIETVGSSLELFGTERITSSPNPVYKIEIKKEKQDETSDLFCFNKQRYKECKLEKFSSQTWDNLQEYGCNYSKKSPATCKKSCSEFERLEESFIPETEELFPSKIRKTRGNKDLLFNPELSTERRRFVTDTERIDLDTSSESEEVKVQIISGGKETDSDKTVSDLIEEPTTQECVGQLESDVNLSKKLTTISAISRDTLPTNSPQIHTSISPRELNSPHISIVDISVETTPPRAEGDNYTVLAANLDSGKKKKSRPKKGSLSARLQKLISGQVSGVRLWRHQMFRDPTTERSPAPCTTLLVVKSWNEYGKDLYDSKILDDPHNLLHNYYAQPCASRNLVVMTNPAFIGSIKLTAGTVFRIYLPWEILKPNSNAANLVLHVLYFNVVSNSCAMKSESNGDDQLEDVNNVNCKVLQEFDCPCLKNGKIDGYCLTKFSNSKVDVIEKMIEQ